MMDFIRTTYGKKFFDSQLPKLIKELGRVASALEKANELKEAEIKVELRKEEK